MADPFVGDRTDAITINASVGAPGYPAVTRISRESAVPRGGWRHRALAAGEHVEAVVGDEDRVLELGGALAVGGDRGPVVVPHAVLPRAEGDHRLDRERHARAHDDRVAARVVVVEDLHVGVELLTDAVADKRLH